MSPAGSDQGPKRRRVSRRTVSRFLGRSRGLARFEGIRFRLGAALAIALLPILVLPAVLAWADLTPLGNFLAPVVAWIVAFATVMLSLIHISEPTRPY